MSSPPDGKPVKGEPFRQITYPLGMRMDITHIGEVLDILDSEGPFGPDSTATF